MSGRAAPAEDVNDDHSHLGARSRDAGDAAGVGFDVGGGGEGRGEGLESVRWVLNNSHF